MVARVLLPLALILAMAGTASAEKQKLAVLGLEVAGSIDTASTSYGRSLTDALRMRVGVSPRFTLAPNSSKDLLDEKVATGCDNETADCMAKIGLKLKAQILIYGKLEKRPKDKQEGYQLSLKALDTDKKTVKEWAEWIPLTDFADSKLDARIARGFDVLTKDDAATTGTTGTGTIGPTGPIGTPTPRNPPKKSGGFPWKPTAYVATGVTVALVGGLAYYGLQVLKTEDNCPAKRGDGAFDDPETYRGQPLGSGYTAERCATDGPKFSKMTWITGLSAAAIGGFALFAYYEGFIAKKESPTNPNAGSRTRKKKNIAVTPIVSPDGAGATVRIDW